jgi:fatty acid desaturase
MRSDDSLWRPHAGSFAWPTLLLLGAVIALVAGAWVGSITGTIPLAVGALLSTVAAYLAFTVMHEAVHGNVHGNDRSRAWVGELAGWIASATLIAPYPAFRVLHLRHHSYTNHPDKDPDYFVRGPLWAAVVFCLKTIPHYYAEFLIGPTSKSTAAQKERRWVYVGIGLYASIALALSALGLWREVLALWIAPAVVASAILAFFFDWLPHHPHESRERFHDTRAIDIRILDLPLLGQNLHLIHHLFPRVPFYRYRAVLEAARGRLAEEGAPVITPSALTSPARPTPR